MLRRKYSKKILLIASSFVLLVVSTNAKKPVFAGPKFGFAHSNLWGNDAGENSFISGFSGGGFLLFELSKLFSFQPELLFVMKGAKDTINTSSIKLNYLAIPLLVKLKVPVKGSIRPSIFTGGELSYLVNAYVRESVNSWNVRDSILKFDCGLVFGAGLELILQTGRLMVDGRFTFGLIPNDANLADRDVKNRAFSLMIGYALPIRGK